MICRSDVVSSATSVSACYNMLIDCRAAATATESHDPRVGVAGSASSHGFRKMAKRTVTGAAVPRNPTSDNQGCRRGGAQPVSPRVVDSSMQMELVSNRMEGQVPQYLPHEPAYAGQVPQPVRAIHSLFY